MTPEAALTLKHGDKVRCLCDCHANKTGCVWLVVSSSKIWVDLDLKLAGHDGPFRMAFRPSQLELVT